MGNRIHKAIGYGALVKLPPFFQQDFYEKASKTSLAKFARFCTKNRAAIEATVPVADYRHKMFKSEIKIVATTAGGTLSDYIKNDDEMGIEGALLLIPPSFEGWSRYDDIIDYTEECAKRHSPIPSFQTLYQGIYPHSLGKPPLTVAALCLWLKMPELFPRLQETLYTWWS